MIEISMTEAAPFLRECLKKIRSYGTKCTIIGIPLCILGEDYLDFYDQPKLTANEAINLFPHISIPPHIKKLSECLYREKTSKQKSNEICPKCKYHSFCEGIQERYILKYGFRDLKVIN